MNSKTFEIRDAMTFIPVLAVQLSPATEADRYLIARAGYPTQASGQAQFIIFLNLNDNEAEYDYNRWNGRTLGTAHAYICDHWPELESGAVIDVQYILGERPEPKRSESETAPL